MALGTELRHDVAGCDNLKVDKGNQQPGYHTHITKPASWRWWSWKTENWLWVSRPSGFKPALEVANIPASTISHFLRCGWPCVNLAALCHHGINTAVQLFMKPHHFTGKALDSASPGLLVVDLLLPCWRHSSAAAGSTIICNGTIKGQEPLLSPKAKCTLRVVRWTCFWSGGELARI